MDYISWEEFLNQPEEVQKAFINWWEPVNGERIFSTGISSGECIYLGDYKESGYEVLRLESNSKALTAKKVFIPLLQMHQLIRFIQGKGYKFIGINNFLDSWNIKVFKSMMQLEPDMEFCCDTPLECYWQAACKIAAMEE